MIMNTELKTLYIRPTHIPNGQYLCLLGLIGILLTAILSFLLPNIAPAAITILLISTLILTLIGYMSYQDEALSFTLTFMHIQFHSPYGGWTTRWTNIEQIAQATIEQDGWHQPIPWVGIKLKDYEGFIEDICPRVASKLLIEQRPLLVMAHKRSGNTNEQLEDILFDDSHVTLSSGKTFKGLQAMLANRMRYNRAYLGYDFFISEDTLDRPAADFAGLVRRYLANSHR
ncbi:DUF2982 domain-containing protein [Photobacterium makurazakiensis]|uniref:DUF2982 domain-containing protein n=1 Tax=Photobacterium makurazakiensis TaxID=2910234 RepID=UPI003D0FA309